MLSKTILKSIIFFVRTINLFYYHFSSFLEKLSKTPLWAQELGEYFKISPKKVINNYLIKRPRTAKLWGKKKRTTETKIQSFYQETDYFIYRQSYFHRHKIYLDVALGLLLKKKGSLCEYGGGIGPLTNWLIKFFPSWNFTIADLNCPVLTFSKWRYKNKPQVNFSTITPTKLPLKNSYDIILCKHVLEHISDPFAVAQHLINHLEPGGWLFIDFIKDSGEENLESAQKKRTETISFLNKQLNPIFALNSNNSVDGYGLYFKPR